MKNDKIQKVVDILNYLDGRGIDFEDEELIRKELKTINFWFIQEGERKDTSNVQGK